MANAWVPSIELRHDGCFEEVIIHILVFFVWRTSVPSVRQIGHGDFAFFFEALLLIRFRHIKQINAPVLPSACMHPRHLNVGIPSMQIQHSSCSSGICFAFEIWSSSCTGMFR
jgi:hypothetical protein